MVWNRVNLIIIPLITLGDFSDYFYTFRAETIDWGGEKFII
jgi:hypothetical protein